MEQLTGPPPPVWEDDAEMKRLRLAFRTSEDERGYVDAVRAWTVEEARYTYDLAPDNALRVAESVLVEVRDGTTALYTATWPELQPVLSSLLSEEVAARHGEPTYGDGDETAVQLHLLRGARAVTKDVEAQHDAAQEAYSKILKQPWFRAGEKRAAGLYFIAGKRAALSDVRADAARAVRELKAEKRQLRPVDNPIENTVLRRAELIALVRARQEGRLVALNRAVEFRAAPYCLYHQDSCAIASDLLDDCDDALAAFEPLADYWRLLEPYLEKYRDRSLGRYNFSRKVRRCAEWRTYTLFSHTQADDAHREGHREGSTEADPLRWQLVKGWGTHANGDWNSQYGPKRQIKPVVDHDPLFAPLLWRNKPEVATALGVATPTDPTGDPA